MAAQIISLGRGNVVFVPTGGYKDEEDEFGCVWRFIDDCYTIKDWGTTAGLGQLAAKGPQEDTEFEVVGYRIGVPIPVIHGVWHVKDESMFSELVDSEAKRLLND